MDSPATRAIASTLFISLVPITFLFLIPVSGATRKSSSGSSSHSHALSLLPLLLSFAVGSLLGDVFIHLIPHAFSSHSHAHVEHQAHPSHMSDHHTHTGDHHTHTLDHHTHSHDAHDMHARGLLEVDSHDHSAGLWKGIMVLVGFFLFVAVELSLSALTQPVRAAPRASKRGDSDLQHPKEASKSESEHDKLLSTSSPNQDVRQRRLKGSGSDPELLTPSGSPVSPSSSSSKERQISTTGYLNLLSDFLHNFTDGLAIAITYYTSPAVGISTTVAIFFHEVPHEISDFAILLSSGFSKSEALLAQVFTAVGAMLGTVCGILIFQLGAGDSELQLELPEKVEALVLPFTAGGFLFIATRTLFGPELGLFTSLDSHSHHHHHNTGSVHTAEVQDEQEDPPVGAFARIVPVISHLLCIAAGVGLMTGLSLFE